MRTRMRTWAGVVLAAGTVAVGGCAQHQPSAAPASPTTGSAAGKAATDPAGPASGSPSPSQSPHRRLPRPFRHRIPGMPAPLPGGVYAAARPGNLQPFLRHEPRLVYVPEASLGGRTIVISQRTRRIVRILDTGELNQHVTPAWDLKKLYVEASVSNHLAVLDPHTGQMTGSIPTDRPYNLYFTPNGRQAIVMDEEHNQIVFSDPHTFARQQVVQDPACSGPNHADFSANGRYFIVTCEFSRELLKVSTLKHRVIGHIPLPPGAMPQDVRLAPNGRSFFVADMGRSRLLQIPWRRFRIVHEYPTLAMPHGIYFSRNQRRMFVTDRMAGAVQVFSLRRHRFVRTWWIPGGGSPDMGNLSADGRTLWLSGRYNSVVYAFDTRTGRVTKIPVPGSSPHGLLVWPQPGRYSLGHTGEMR